MQPILSFDQSEMTECYIRNKQSKQFFEFIKEIIYVTIL